MPRSTIKLYLSFALFFVSISSVHSFDADTSGASSIDFVSMEATVSSKIVHFKWDVESESSGDYFIIEKSIDQENWTEVKRIQSIEDHKERHTYEVSEIDFAQDYEEYFRILRVDHFGQISELDRVNINRPVLSNMLMVPVPKKVNKEITVSYDSMISSRGVLKVLNEEGEMVVEQKIEFSEGYNRVNMPIKSYEKGHYSIVIEDQFGNKLIRSLTIHGTKGKPKF